MKNFNLLTLLLMASLSFHANAKNNANYDESKIKPYTLPDVLTTEKGKKVKSVKEWEKTRRSEILNLFKSEVYGHFPALDLKPSSVKVLEESNDALNGTAQRKQLEITFENNGQSIKILILIYLPSGVENPPVFVGYNFYGNHTITNDPEVILHQSWVPNRESFGITNFRATEESRGKRTNRWPVQKMIDQGFGLATIYYGDVDPDRNDFSDGLHPLFYKNGQEKPSDTEWGSIGAWAWGMSRAVDYLETDTDTKRSNFIAFGHSRLGKTSLWAGATDERFDMIISNNSGCGGAALSRRNYGETIDVINHAFPHWFADSFNQYNNNESDLPIDQHQLIALMAPRPVYIASAEDDRWADPKGEYLSGYHASEVYALYKKNGFTSEEPPSVNQPIHTIIGYHMRTGIHDVTDYDWNQYMAFYRKNFE